MLNSATQATAFACELNGQRVVDLARKVGLGATWPRALALNPMFSHFDLKNHVISVKKNLNGCQ